MAFHNPTSKDYCIDMLSLSRDMTLKTAGFCMNYTQTTVVRTSKGRIAVAGIDRRLTVMNRELQMPKTIDIDLAVTAGFAHNKQLYLAGFLKDMQTSRIDIYSPKRLELLGSIDILKPVRKFGFLAEDYLLCFEENGTIELIDLQENCVMFTYQL